MTVLAIETSCDETAVAVLQGDKLLASEIASQTAQHERFGGVVPEVASRNHLLELPRLLARATELAHVDIPQLDAFAATSGPGLASSLLVGSSAAKGLAMGANKPFLAINHLEGHLLSPFFGRDHIEANVGLVVSGGHTLLVKVSALGEYEVLGRTMDDAAGEAFDKVGKLLGLRYPGGPQIEQLARAGNPDRFDLPRAMLSSGDLNFSFSGLKTAVRYLLPKLSTRRIDKVSHDVARPEEFSQQDVRDVSASFQQAVIDVLREKTLEALRQTGLRRLTLSGGVSCNDALRDTLQNACQDHNVEFLPAEPWLCTDNAAMIAFAAMLRLREGLVSSLSEEIDPNLALT